MNEVTGHAVVDGFAIVLEPRKTTFRGDARLCRLSRAQKGELKRRAAQVIAARAKADPAHAAKAALNWPDAESLRAAKDRHKPIGDPASPGARAGQTGRWRDSSRDPYGGRRGGGNQRTTWAGGNCLRATLATILQRDIDTVPDPEDDFPCGDEWLEAYDKRLREACGVRLERIEAHACPPDNRSLWIAALQGEIYGDTSANHALTARGNFVYHDSANDHLRGQSIPKDKLLFGFRVVAAHTPKTDLYGKAIQ